MFKLIQLRKFVPEGLVSGPSSVLVGDLCFKDCANQNVCKCVHFKQVQSYKL